MNLLKNKKTVALILSVMMLFSNAAAALALEKVQVGRSDDTAARQYDYETVVSGGSNRQDFVNSIVDAGVTRAVLLMDAGIWYNVTSDTLADVKNGTDESKKNVNPFSNYVPILEGGVTISRPASVLIDEIKANIPLTEAKTRELYEDYAALGGTDKTALTGNTVIQALLDAYAALTGTDPEEAALTSIDGVDGYKVTVTITGLAAGVLPSRDDFVIRDSNSIAYGVELVTRVENTAAQFALTLRRPVRGMGTLEVTYNEVTLEYEFDDTVTLPDDGFALVPSSYSATADGSTRITLQLIYRSGGKTNPDFEGTVKFESSRDSKFSKENPVAFDQGIAENQVIVPYYATEIVTDRITVTLVSTPDNTTLQGQEYKVDLTYVPKDSGVPPGDRIVIVDVGSDSASHVILTFDTAIDIPKLWQHLGEISVSRDGELDRAVWRRPVGFEVVPGSEMKKVQLNFLQTQPLRDNSDIYVRVDSTGTQADYLVTQTGNAMRTFKLNDIWTADPVNAVMKSGRVIEATFDDPVVTRDYMNANWRDYWNGNTPNYLTDQAYGVGVVSNWVLNGHKLLDSDLAPVRPLAQTGVDLGTLILTGTRAGELQVYETNTVPTWQVIDNRNKVTIQLSTTGARWLKPEGEINILQVANTSDYAGLVHPQNIANTQEFTFPTVTNIVENPDEDTYVVWISVHDNIYGYRDGQYLISDVVYIQYSKNMGEAVLRSNTYAINNYELPVGVDIVSEDNVSYFSPLARDDQNLTTDGVGQGTLVTITIPYDFLGDKQQRFTTASPNFRHEHPSGNPYEPVDNHTVYFDPFLKSADGDLLDGEFRFTATYNLYSIWWQMPVVAYYNAIYASTADLLRFPQMIATLAQAYSSEYVGYKIYQLPVMYNDQGIMMNQPLDRVSFLLDDSLTANHIPEFNYPLIIKPVTDTRNGRTLPYEIIDVNVPLAEYVLVTGDVEVTRSLPANALNPGITIVADAADYVQLDGTIEAGGAIVRSDSGTDVVINGDVTGDVTITAGNPLSVNLSDVTVNGEISGKLTVDITGDLTVNNSMDEANIINVNSTSVKIARGATIGKITISNDITTTIINEGAIGDVVFDAGAAGADITLSNTGAGMIIGTVTIDQAVEVAITNAVNSTIANVVISVSGADVSIQNVGAITGINLTNNASLDLANWGETAITADNTTSVTLTGTTRPPISGGISNITDNTNANTATPTSL
jgi:hypothetical protein